MIKTTLYASILLTVIWIILCESFTLTTVVTGAVIGVGCMRFFYNFLSVSGTASISFFRLAVYTLYLITQIYLSGFSAIKMILSGADVDIVKIRTRISNGFLRTILANSITLTPGTVSLELTDDEITVFRLMKKSGHSSDTDDDTDDIGEQIKGKLERMLLKAQK